MSTTTVSAFETTGQKSQIWLQELADIGRFDDEQQAYTAMRAVLHCLRDRLTVDEAAHLSSHLPLLIRGVYFEGWKPAATPHKLRTRQEFLGAVADALRGNKYVDPQRAVDATFELLERKISQGEIADIKLTMPGELLQLWPNTEGQGP